jgi:hypothetical protein
MTFDDFLARTRDSHTFSPESDTRSYGTFFVDAMYLQNRGGLARSLMYQRCDPFGKDEVTPEALDFCRRWWDSPLACN